MLIDKFVILQIDAIAYASRKLLDREKKYSTIEKEGFRIVFGIKKFEKIYCEGIRPTDRPSFLVTHEKSKVRDQRIMRWALYLQRYKFTLESVKRKNNVGADYLSRIQKK